MRNDHEAEPESCLFCLPLHPSLCDAPQSTGHRDDGQVSPVCYYLAFHRHKELSSPKDRQTPLGDHDRACFRIPTSHYPTSGVFQIRKITRNMVRCYLFAIAFQGKRKQDAGKKEGLLRSLTCFSMKALILCSIPSHVNSYGMYGSICGNRTW